MRFGKFLMWDVIAGSTATMLLGVVIGWAIPLQHLDERALHEVEKKLARADENIASARRMIAEMLTGDVVVDGLPAEPQPPATDMPPARRRRRWDAETFEARMLSRDRSGYSVISEQGGGQFTVRVPNEGTHAYTSTRIEMGIFGLLGGGNGPTETPIRGMRVADCEFTASPTYTGMSKFGARLYNTVDLTIDGVYFHDFGTRSEHAYYGNPTGSVTFRNILAARLGGQMIQVINREEVGANKDIPDRGENSPVIGGLILVERFVARDCGLNTGRGSFPISIRDLGRNGRQFNVTIRDGLIASAFPAQLRSGRMVRSTGGILVQGLGTDHWRNGTVLIENVVIDVTQTDRALLQVNNCERLIVRGCTFIARDGYYGDVLIDRSDGKYKGSKPCGDVLWINNTGNVRLRVGGKDVGAVGEDFESITSGADAEGILRMFPRMRKAG